MSKIVNVWYKLRIPNLPDVDSSTGVQEKSVLSRLINGVYDLFLDEFVPLKIVAEHLNVYLSVEDATSPDNKLPMDTPIKDIINRVSAQKPLIIMHQLPHDQQQQQATALASGVPAYITSGWEIPYSDRTEQAVDLYRLCAKYMADFDDASSAVYSPYVFVHQSSGMGKSRLMQQVLKYAVSMGVRCYYFCVRSATGDAGKAWPPRSPIAQILQTYTSEEHWYHFFKCLLSYNSQVHPDSSQSWQENLKTPLSLSHTIPTTTSAEVESLSRGLKPNRDGLGMLIVFDEVGGLEKKNGFNSLVRSLMHVRSTFLLCADTTSLLPQFVAPDITHGSFRVSVEGRVSFPLIICWTPLISYVITRPRSGQPI
jgi:hypothetical protein